MLYFQQRLAFYLCLEPGDLSFANCHSWAFCLSGILRNCRLFPQYRLNIKFLFDGLLLLWLANFLGFSMLLLFTLLMSLNDLFRGSFLYFRLINFNSFRWSRSSLVVWIEFALRRSSFIDKWFLLLAYCLQQDNILLELLNLKFHLIYSNVFCSKLVLQFLVKHNYLISLLDSIELFRLLTGKRFDESSKFFYMFCRDIILLLFQDKHLFKLLLALLQVKRSAILILQHLCQVTCSLSLSFCFSPFLFAI